MTPGLLKDQLAKGKTWFVRQTFLRGAEKPTALALRMGGATARGGSSDAMGRGATSRGAIGSTAGDGRDGGTSPRPFLIRAYAADEKSIADLHIARLAKDPNAFLYYAADAEHLRRLAAAARQPAGYQIFYAAKKGIEWKPPPKIQNQIKEHIRQYHPAWRTKRDGDKIKVGLFEEFGELYLKFNFGDEEETIALALIER